MRIWPSFAPSLADAGTRRVRDKGIKGLRKKGGRFKGGGGRRPYYAPNLADAGTRGVRDKPYFVPQLRDYEGRPKRAGRPRRVGRPERDRKKLGGA